MTTKNIQDLQKFLDQSDKANQAIADAAEERAKQVLEAQTEADREREKAELRLQLAQRRAEIAKRARQQLHDDESKQRDEADAERDEEAGQLGFILNGTESSSNEPVEEPEAPVPPADPEPEVSVLPPAPEPPAPVNEPRLPAEPEPQRTAVLDRINPHRWGKFSWIFAILNALLFGWVAGQVGISADKDSLQNLVSTLWVLGWSAVGFAAGGWFGSFFDSE